MGNVLAPSPELHSTLHPLLGPHYISLYTGIYTRTHARTQRGPCSFHVEQGESGKGKEDGEQERGLWGERRDSDAKSTPTGAKRNQLERTPHPTPQPQSLGRGAPHETITTLFLF